MVRKKSWKLLIGVIVLLFFGCKSKSESDTQDIEDLFSLVGMKKADVYEKLNIDENQNIVLHSHRPHLFVLKEEQTIYGESLNLGFYIDPEYDTVIGFEFIKELKGEAKEGYDLTKSLYNSLHQEFGNPDINLNQKYKASNIPDFDEIENQGEWSGGKEWDMDNGFIIFLNAQIIPENATIVSFQYTKPKYAGGSIKKK